MKPYRLAVTLLYILFFSRPGFALGRLYPQGDKFCFTFYSTKDADSIYTLQHGATAIGPYYGDQAGPLAKAVSLDTAFIYKIRPACMAGTNFLDPAFVMPTDAQIISDTAAIVNAIKNNLHIAMWDIEPEELRHWKPQEMHYLDMVASTIRVNDPYHRPVYMYEPNHRNAYDLKQTLKYQDICAKGMYVEAAGYRYNRIWCRWSMEQELEAVASVKPSAVPWIVLWMAWDADAAEKHLIDDWCRHDAYMGLVLGGKGIQIWSGWRGRTGFSNTDFDAYLNGYLSVANDLNGPLNLAPVFLYGQKQNDVTMNITSGPTTLSLNYDSSTFNYPPLTYLSTIYDNREYLFIVNSAQEAVAATFSGVPDADMEDLFNGSSSPTPGGVFSITLPSLAVRAFRFAGTVGPPSCVPVLAEDFAGRTVAGLAGQGWTFSGQDGVEVVQNTSSSDMLGADKNYLHIGGLALSQPFAQKSFGNAARGKLSLVTFTTSSYSNARIKLLDSSDNVLFAFRMTNPTSIVVENTVTGFSASPMLDNATHNLLSTGGNSMTELTVEWNGGSVIWQAINRNADTGTAVYNTGLRGDAFGRAGTPSQVRFDSGTYNHTARFFGITDLLVCRYVSPGDIDRNGIVDMADFSILGNQWLTDGAAVPSADIAPPTGDNFVGIDDLLILVENWFGAE